MATKEVERRKAARASERVVEGGRADGRTDGHA